MSPMLIAFYLFAALTILFALTLLWRVLPRAAQPKHDFVGQTQALSNVVTMGPNADSIKTIAEAVSTILKALADFGSKLDAFGPTALLGVFTVIFAMLTVACAWIAH